MSSRIQIQIRFLGKDPDPTQIHWVIRMMIQIQIRKDATDPNLNGSLPIVIKLPLFSQ